MYDGISHACLTEATDQSGISFREVASIPTTRHGICLPRRECMASCSGLVLNTEADSRRVMQPGSTDGWVVGEESSTMGFPSARPRAYCVVSSHLTHSSTGTTVVPQCKHGTRRRSGASCHGLRSFHFSLSKHRRGPVASSTTEPRFRPRGLQNTAGGTRDLLLWSFFSLQHNRITELFPRTHGATGLAFQFPFRRISE